TASVGRVPLTLVALGLTPVEGQPVPAGVVGKVFSATPASLAGYQVEINWGDGSAPEAGVLDADGSVRSTNGHVYAQAGPFPIQLNLLQGGDRGPVAQGRAEVAINWDLHWIGLDVNANGILDETLDGGVPDGLANYLPGYQ